RVSRSRYLSRTKKGRGNCPTQMSLVYLDGLPVDMLAVIVIGPVIFKVVGILVGSRANAENGPAVFDATFILLSPFLGNAPADQCADESARKATGSGSG